MTGHPPGDGLPPSSWHAAPTGHAGQGDSVGRPHPHTRAHSTWVADPNSPPSGRAVGEGTAPDLRRPSQWWKAPPPGTPFRHPHSEQRQPARAHAVGPVPGPHARIDRTRDTRVAEPWLPAPEDRRPGEGQRLTPDAPHNGGRPSPPGTVPHHAKGMQAKGNVLGPHTHTPAPTARGWRAATARPVGGQSGEGQRLTSDAPHNSGRHPPGTPLRHPHREQRQLAGAHTVGSMLGPHAPTERQLGHTGRGTLGARSRGRAAGGGTAPYSRRPSQWWKAPPPRDALPPPPQRATPARKDACCGAAAGSSSPHRPHPGHTGRRILAARSRGRAAGGGTAPDTRCPSQRWQATPPGDGPPPLPQHAAPTGHAG